MECICWKEIPSANGGAGKDTIEPLNSRWNSTSKTVTTRARVRYPKQKRGGWQEDE